MQTGADPTAATGPLGGGRPVVSLSEVLSALSYALDLTEGQPYGHAVRSCLIGMRIAGTIGLDADTRSALYYALILKDTGCSSNAAPMAEYFAADDRTVKRGMRALDWTRTSQAGRYALAVTGAGRPVLDRARRLAHMARTGQRMAREFVRMRCERGADIVRRLGFPAATAEGIFSLDEHWDGGGHPEGRRGGTIPLLSRIIGLAQAADVSLIAGGPAAAVRTARSRRGTWFDPDLVKVFTEWATNADWWASLRGPEATRMVIAAEPADRVRRIEEDASLDAIAAAFADIIDAKSPYTYHHSSGVAAYARGIARALGQSAGTQHLLHRAGLLHDIGKLGVSNRILDKPGPLTDEERRAVEQHPIYTREILSRIRVVETFATMASLHHERLDGSGYPWKVDAAGLDLPSRILAVTDVYEALTAKRPYREALSSEAAIGILDREAGPRLDPDAVGALRRSPSEPAAPAPPAH